MTARILCAWFVHFYSALGAVIALLAIRAIEAGDFKYSFQLMAFAVAIDATDGSLARAFRVKERLPWFDGARLDDIIDYLNYVVVPCLLLLRAELLPKQDELWLAAIPLIASAYGFCRTDAKTSDHFFLGFPSYWNVVAFYLYVLKAPPWVNAFVVIILAVMVFVPLKYVYPSRSPRFRWQTNALGVLWGLALLVIMHRLPNPPTALVIVSLAYPAYYLALSLWLELCRPSELRHNT
jgi:phosphatidylcholine synthase